MDLDVIWRGYERAAIGDLDRTPATLAAYRTAWHEWSGFLRPPQDAQAVLDATVRYRDDLRRRRLASNTVYGRLASVRAVWRWALDTELVAEDPLRRFRLPRKVSHPRPAIDKDAYEALIGRLAELDPVPRVMIALAAYAGLRAGEIRNLDADDIDIPNQRITMRQGKGRKDREVRMHPDLARVLEVTQGGPPCSIADRIRTLCSRDALSLTAASARLGLNPKRLREIVGGGGIQRSTAAVWFAGIVSGRMNGGSVRPGGSGSDAFRDAHCWSGSTGRGSPGMPSTRTSGATSTPARTSSGPPG